MTSTWPSFTLFNRPVFAVLALVALFWMASAPASAARADDWFVDITNDRVDGVRQQLRRGVDPNRRAEDGTPSIMHAIREGAWQVYDLLAANKRTDVNALNDLGETPLMYLAVVGETKRAAALIARGAEVNKLGWTPLQYAVSRGHLDTARLLLDKGALINAPGPDGTTALMMAAYSGEQSVVQYLLNRGADPTMLTTRQETAGDWARRKGFDDLGRKLDAVESRVLAYRDALRREAGKVTVFGLDGASQSHTEVRATSAIPKPDLSLEARGADTGPGSAAQESPNGGTSRYFDLDRFNQPSAP